MVNFEPKFLSIYCMGNEPILRSFQVQNVIFLDYLVMYALKFSIKSYVSFNFSSF
jgi:hypothetical protein